MRAISFGKLVVQNAGTPVRLGLSEEDPHYGIL